MSFSFTEPEANQLFDVLGRNGEIAAGLFDLTTLEGKRSFVEYLRPFYTEWWIAHELHNGVQMEEIMKTIDEDITSRCWGCIDFYGRTPPDWE